MFAPKGFTPESSANWLIKEISKEAMAQGSLLSARDLEFLSTDIRQVPENERHFAVASINLCVGLVRCAIERSKNTGTKCITVREGLVLPQIWEDHYETVYESEFPWLISLVMQNAFMGNPLSNETQAWVSE